ncbi:GlxA family transcriptional regulator [Ruegeria sp. SCP11]|uniref:GlxA family transcriptional regulator n=1 Tax=Ruegeria sp. SCP11 TaxID=3141378 RepID=UPI0033358FBF
MTPLKANILLFEKFSNMLLACLLEPLRVVRDQTGADISWSIVTPNDDAVRSSSGLRLSPDITRADAGSCDLLMVVGGDDFRQNSSDPASRRCAALIKRAKTVIGADTGAWFLASWGLLEGRRATLHWQTLAEFAEAFPGVETLPDRFVRDGSIWTCGGASTAMDLMIAFISERYGDALAHDAASMFLHDGSRFEGLGSGSMQPKGSQNLRRCISIMAENVETPLQIEDISKRANLSVRSLSRIFVKELGMPPQRYYQLMRLSRARDLVAHTDLVLNEVAMRCGYSSAQSLSKAFSRQFGVSIGSTRKHKQMW